MILRTIYLSTLTTEYVYATTEGPIDPTGAVVSFSFPQVGSEPTVWHQGVWEGLPVGDSFRSTAKYCIPAGTLVPGKYAVWIKVDGQPESPVRQVGYLRVGI